MFSVTQTLGVVSKYRSPELEQLQALPDSLGGAGSSRIEWEFDDAVFMESASVIVSQLSWIF